MIRLHARAAVTFLVAAAIGVPALSPQLASAASPSPGAESTGAVDIVPVDTSRLGPNDGQWFVFALAAGHTERSRALLINPSKSPQTVTLTARQLNYSANGTPSVSDNPTEGVARWVTFPHPTVTVPARSKVVTPFVVTVPDQVEPGDHTGALMATATPVAAGSYVVTRRIATRFTVTTPGVAVVSYRLKPLGHELDSRLWPHRATVSASIVNTGNVRFTPQLKVNGVLATGSSLVLAQSVERYTARVKVPWYGGHIHARYVATADGGHQKTVDVSFWAIPWLLIALVLVGLGVLVHVGRLIRRRWKRSRAERQALRARVEQLEASLAEGEADLPRPRASTDVHRV